MKRDAISGRTKRDAELAQIYKGFQLPQAIADCVDHLPGSVLMVPDDLWEIDVPDRHEHPGFCHAAKPASWKAIMLLGRDPRSAWNLKDAYHVRPSRKNGLTKTTAFELIPRKLRLDLICKLKPNRRLGELDEHDAVAIRRDLERIFPET
jgi:hypothetical protein